MKRFYQTFYSLLSVALIFISLSCSSVDRPESPLTNTAWELASFVEISPGGIVVTSIDLDADSEPELLVFNDRPDLVEMWTSETSYDVPVRYVYSVIGSTINIILYDYFTETDDSDGKPVDPYADSDNIIGGKWSVTGNILTLDYTDCDGYHMILSYKNVDYSGVTEWIENAKRNYTNGKRTD